MLKKIFKKGLFFGLLVVAASIAADTYKGPETAIQKERQEDTSGGGLIGKSSLSISTGDLEMSFGGRTKVETYQAKNVVMLNSHIPDRLNYFKQTLDFTTNVGFGKQKFGYKAIEFYTDIRAKAVWGDSGAYFSTLDEDVKLDGTGVVVGNHKHKSLRPYLGVREAWLQFTLNSLFPSKDAKLHNIKLGFFPFTLGRGIVLGDIYGVSKDFLGISTGYNSDQFSPGINLHGELIKDKLTYDLYFAILEENTDTLGKTFNFVKSNTIGRLQTPWRGFGKDNQLYAARMQWNAFESDKYGSLDIEPYWLYNEGSDRWIEFDGDSKSELGSAGLGCEYSYGDFEFGAEGAFNYGREIVFALDRNVLILGRDSSGNVVTKYSKVLGSQGGSSVQVSTANKTAVDANAATVNSKFNDTSSDVLVALNNTEISPGLWNSSDRYRPYYRNKYAGWMFVTDLAYKFKKADLKLAGAYGFASGDKNPHLPRNASTEHNKTYHGFIGLQEGYSGPRVPSVLVLDSRKLKRPLSVSAESREAEDDATFTDMHYIGTGLKWFPLNHDEKKFYLWTNVLGFIKAHRSHKYDSVALHYDHDRYASNFLGIEWNVRVKYEMLKNLFLFGDGAIFFPGTYYKDMKGLPLSGDLYNKLNDANKTDIDPLNYRISNDTAYFLNAGLDYKF